jgi:Flp pilus assembly pilin Flp
LRLEIGRRVCSGRCAPVLDEVGQGLAEYGLVLSFVAVACVAAVVFLSGNIQNVLSSIGSTI